MPTDLTPVDDDLAAALAAERGRQRETLSLIASENHASDAGYRAFVLNTGADNERARGFYEALGFDPVDEVTVDFGEVVLALALYRREIG